MATLRERRPGVWEIRIFTGRDANGRPTQVSKTVRGTKREAQRVAAALESRPPSNAGGRTVADVLAAWREVNEPIWAETSRRDYESRVGLIVADPIASLNVARLSVADVERWHARMRKTGVGEAAIRSRHSTLRAALAQAVRWDWVGVNVASQARLRQPKRASREAMSAEDVRAAIDAARQIDPAAALALRLAAVAGLRRAELAALRWTDIDGSRLKVDSSACAVRGNGETTIEDVPTKTGNARVVPLDDQTAKEIEELRVVREQLSPYMFSDCAAPANPDRIGWWWQRARELSGIDKRWRLHDLRHWTATAAITSGHDVRTVAGRLGHANPAMTLRVYAHADDGADRVLADSLGRMLDDGRRREPAPVSDHEPVWSARWRPVEVPQELDESPPISGRVRLPVDIAWSGQAEYDLADPRQLRRVYEQVLREGTAGQVRQLVRASALLDVWDDLVLPANVRSAWEPWIDAHREN